MGGGEPPARRQGRLSTRTPTHPPNHDLAIVGGCLATAPYIMLPGPLFGEGGSNFCQNSLHFIAHASLIPAELQAPSLGLHGW